jgi:hypothetical protein
MLGGRMEWVGMSRGRFVGGRNVKAQKATPILWSAKQKEECCFRRLFSFLKSYFRLLTFALTTPAKQEKKAIFATYFLISILISNYFLLPLATAAKYCC